MKRYIFFIFDNRSLICVLSILEQLKEYDSVEFVVCLENLAWFIRSRRIPKSKVILVNKRLGSLRKIGKLIAYKREIKDIYEKEFADKKDYAVFFFEMGFELLLLYLIKRLSRKNRIFYYEHFSYSPFNIDHSIKSRIWQLLYWYVYSLSVDIYKINMRSSFPAVKANFLSRNKIDVIDNNIDFESASVLKKYAWKDNKLAKTKVLFLLTDFEGAGMVSQSASDLFHKRLASLLDRYFGPSEIIIKMHPTFHKNIDSSFVKYQKVDSRVPAEAIFFSANFKLIMGIGSVALKSAVKFGNFLALALFKLVDFNDTGDIRWLEKNLCTDDINPIGKLLIPQTWEELEIFIRSVSEHAER